MAISARASTALAAVLAAGVLWALLATSPGVPRAATPDPGTTVAGPAAQAGPGVDCPLTTRGLPTCGALVGATHGANTPPTSLEAAAGRPLGIRRTFYTPGQVARAVRTAREDLRGGRLPWISFKLPTDWAAMAAGDGDPWARRVARRLARLPGPVWVAFHHEPEGDGDIQDWRRMQERLAPLVRGLADNVGFTVVLTGWNQMYGEEKYSLERVWPRDVTIDLAGFDVYNDVGVTRGGRTELEWPDLGAEYFAPIAAWAAAHDVAWGLAETGITDTAAEVEPRWIQETYADLVHYGGVAFTYFDSYLNSIGSWPLETRTKQEAFRETLLSSPRAWWVR